MKAAAGTSPRLSVAAQDARGVDLSLSLAAVPPQFMMEEQNWRSGDSRLGARFAAQARHMLRSCEQAAAASGTAFYFYDAENGIWVRDMSSRATAIYLLMLAEMRKEAKNIGSTKDRLTAEMFVSRADTRARMVSTFAFAKADPLFSVMLADFDAKPDLLNLANGSYVLSTGEFCEHRSDYLLTQRCSAHYDPAANCPVFERTLLQIFHPEKNGDKDETLHLLYWLQRYFGYCISAEVNEHLVVAFAGNGGNGKGIIMDIIKEVMGTYAVTVPFKVLQAHDAGNGGQATPELASLRGARLCFAEEPEADRQLDTGTLKWISGGGEISARYLHGQPFRFMPTHKMILAFNERPSVPDNSDGTWRRFKLVPFPNQFLGARRDNRLAEKLRAEKSGILNWLLEGYRLWRAKPLMADEAAVITAATAEYRDDEDPIAPFLREKCVVGEGEKANLAALFFAYGEWLGSPQYKGTAKKLSRRLVNKGFVKTRDKKCTVFHGLSISAD